MKSSTLKTQSTVFVFCLFLGVLGCDGTGPPENDVTTDSENPAEVVKKDMPPETFVFKVSAPSVSIKLNSTLPEIHVPSDNPSTPEKIALGKELFFDPLLSIDESMSCATCHDPEKGWSNGEAFAEGFDGTVGKRNVPSILNSAFYKGGLFWDGRADTLEEQALMPIFNKEEMGIESKQQLVDRVAESKNYQEKFAEVFKDGVTAENIARALACFERTIMIKETPYDRYMAGDKSAMSNSAIRGLKLFNSRFTGNCASCHPAPMFTDDDYHNIGVGMDQPNPDLGYHHTTGFAGWGKFRSPSLRGIAKTGPYMHDGSLKTLEEVVDYYDKGGIAHKYTDNAMQNLRLSDQQKKDMVNFMREGLSECED